MATEEVPAAAALPQGSAATATESITTVPGATALPAGSTLPPATPPPAPAAPAVTPPPTVPLAPTAAPVSPAPTMVHCTAGPDKDKRFALSNVAMSLGRAASCNVASDDPDAAAEHVIFSLDQGRPSFRAVGQAPLFVDGLAQAGGTLTPGQQLRIGRSLWQVEVPAAASPGVGGWLEDLRDRITNFAGVEKIEGFDLRQFFSEVFRWRSDEDIEERFNVGARGNTPALADVDTAWPRPWLFVWTLGLGLLVYLGFRATLTETANTKLIPGLIFVGAFAIPLALLTFFFEINVLRNISLYQIIKLVLIGGILSLIISLFFYSVTKLGETWLGAMSAGLVEETGKGVVLLLMVNKMRYRWTLNGLVLGAAVGAAFAAFETAGYAFESGQENGGYDTSLGFVAG
jgi:protease PrsW